MRYNKTNGNVIIYYNKKKEKAKKRKEVERRDDVMISQKRVSMWEMNQQNYWD